VAHFVDIFLFALDLLHQTLSRWPIWLLMRCNVLSSACRLTPIFLINV
jgi:hypothetical protein